MKCHTCITSIKRIPGLKGHIHVLVSAEVGQPYNFSFLKDFCCEQWLSNFPTRIFLYHHISKLFANNTFICRAFLQYLACITPLYRGKNRQDTCPQFPLPPDTLLQTPYAVFSEHLLSSQYNSIGFADAEHPALLHIRPMRLKCVWGKFGTNLLSITSVKGWTTSSKRILSVWSEDYSFSSPFPSPIHDMFDSSCNYTHTKAECLALQELVWISVFPLH